MKWRKLHELWAWDERRIFRARQAARMGTGHAPEEWRRVLAAQASPPGAPPMRVRVSDETIELHPLGRAGQLELGAIAEALGDWRISNARDITDPSLPFRLLPMLGADAFTRRNSWRRRTYRVPMILRAQGQPHPRAWAGLRDALGADLERTYSASEVDAIGARAIGLTLAGEEASRYWMGRR